MVAGYVSLLCSISDKPLEYWSKQQSQSGRIRKILDSDLLENVIEIQDFEQPNSYGTSIICPSDSSQFLNIELPILVVVIKNVNLQCRLQVQVVDTENCLHHFQFTNAEAERQNSRGVICRAKIKLDTGWNKLELNLSNLTQAAFKSQYAIAQRIQISGNCRLRRVYFIDKHYEHQEICPKLYHGFLDSYMLKWGIHSIERSSQTSSKRNKSKSKGGNTLKKSSIDNLSDDDISKPSTRRRTAEDHFMKNLQLKTDILINNFFDRRSAKLPRALDFKQNTKLKPYALPPVAANLKPSNPGVSEEAMKKINILRTFTDIHASNDHKRKEDNIMEGGIQDDWKHRYLLTQDRTSKSSDVTKHNLKRTMLEHKPKSLQLLPGFVKTGSSGSPKKSGEPT